jgi:hypothetical protein
MLVVFPEHGELSWSKLRRLFGHVDDNRHIESVNWILRFFGLRFSTTQQDNQHQIAGNRQKSEETND